MNRSSSTCFCFFPCARQSLTGSNHRLTVTQSWQTKHCIELTHTNSTCLHKLYVCVCVWGRLATFIREHKWHILLSPENPDNIVGRVVLFLRLADRSKVVPHYRATNPFSKQISNLVTCLYKTNVPHGLIIRHMTFYCNTDQHKRNNAQRCSCTHCG